MFEDFADQYQNITKSHVSQLGIEELQRGKESVFKVAVALEKFVLDYSQYHLNRAEPLKKITRQKITVPDSRFPVLRSSFPFLAPRSPFPVPTPLTGH